MRDREDEDEHVTRQYSQKLKNNSLRPTYGTAGNDGFVYSRLRRHKQ